MKLPITRSARAEEDLIEIWLHVAGDNPAAADRVLDRIDHRVVQLAAHPLSGAARPDIGDGVRHLVVAPYLVLYRVDSDSVVLLRVLHGRRDLSGELRDDG